MERYRRSVRVNAYCYFSKFSSGCHGIKSRTDDASIHWSADPDEALQATGQRRRCVRARDWIQGDDEWRLV